MLSVKSILAVFNILPSESCFWNGILMKISITADTIKHTMQTHNTGSNPYALYKTPPSTGPINDANELIVLMIELAAIKLSWFTNAGMLACTDGWYAPAIPYRSINVTVSRRMRFTPFISRRKARITAAVKKSSITIIFLLFALSATMPPMGDSKMAGIKAQAVTVP